MEREVANLRYAHAEISKWVPVKEVSKHEERRKKKGKMLGGRPFCDFDVVCAAWQQAGTGSSHALSFCLTAAREHSRVIWWGPMLT